MRVVVACCLGLLALPVPASAASPFEHVWVRSTGAQICIDTATAAPVTFTLQNPDGQTIEQVAGSTADTDSGGCRGASPAGATGQQALFASGYAPGAVVQAAQAGRVVRFGLPFLVARGDAGGQTVRVRNLPAHATFHLGAATFAADAAGAFDGTTQTGDADLGSSATLSDSAGEPVAFDATVAVRRFRVRVGLSDGIGRAVSVTGLTPLGPPASVRLYAADGQTLLDETSVGTRVDAQLSATGSFAVAPPAHAVVRVSQPGWFDAEVTAPVVSIRPGGFDVGLSAGETGSLEPALVFSPTAALMCPGFGAAESGCSAGGLFVVAGDTVTVRADDALQDSFAESATLAGSSGSLDDGGYRYFGGTPTAHGHVAFHNPAHPGRAAYDESGDPVVSDDDGLVDAAGLFAAHVVSGATVHGSGRAFGAAAPPVFTYDLAVSIAGNVVSGKTYGGGHVALVVHRGPLADTIIPPVDAAGGFSATVGDLRAGDEIDVTGADARTHDTTTSVVFAGQVAPRISGPPDGQAVRGTITLSATGAGFGRVLWAGDLGSLDTAAPPFSFAVDTRTVDDGFYRVQLSALGGNSATDYRYLLVDNSPPEGSAGPSQTVAPGSTATIVTGAFDAWSGISSVEVDYGDGKHGRQRGDGASGVFRHIYSGPKTYTVKVTLTDRAGNVRRSSVKIHVTRTLSPPVKGAIPTSIRHGRTLKARLQATQAGELRVHVVTTTGRVAATEVLRFSKAGAHATLTLPTGGLAAGRYVVVEQFAGNAGWAGPIVVGPLHIV